MGKLVLECLEERLKIKKLAKAVYNTLNQTALLKAEIIFADSEYIQSLNHSTRGIDKVTDVLSYPSLDNIRGVVLKKENCITELDGKYIFIGSIVLCKEKIKSQAKELGHSEEDERNYLIIHGLMHLFGYDHIEEDDKKLMREKEKQALLLFTGKEETAEIEEQENKDEAEKK